jgi:hypothetical protein
MPAPGCGRRRIAVQDSRVQGRLQAVNGAILLKIHHRDQKIREFVGKIRVRPECQYMVSVFICIAIEGVVGVVLR